MEDWRNFDVEHLATFTVSQQDEILHPADGMRRLLHMKGLRLRSKKMILRIDRDHIAIYNLFNNGEMIERFQHSRIVEPTAFTSLDPMEIYRNILIFVVKKDSLNFVLPEMHAFYCAGVPSDLIVKHMKMNIAENYRQNKPLVLLPPNNTQLLMENKVDYCT